MDDSIFIHAKNGNKEAIEQVIKTVEPFIFKQCRKLRLKDYDFDDLCQISYLAVLKALPKIHDKHLDSAPSYLMKSIHNALKYEARRVLSKPEESSIENEDHDGIPYVEKLVAKENTEKIFFQSQSQWKIREAYKSLTTEERHILSFYIEDPYGGIKRYAELFKKDYRKSRYLKDKTLKKMKQLLETTIEDDFEL